MTDHPHRDHRRDPSDADVELASAYLDSALETAEHERVEADPSLMALVDRLRSVRAVVGQVEDAAISTREQHLATALGIWDRLPTPGDTPVALADRRARRYRWTRLAAAAAAVVVVGGGVIAVTNTRGADDDSTADLSTASGSLDEAPAATDAALESADGGAEFEVAELPAAAPSDGDQSRADGAPTELADAPPAEGGLDVLESRQDLADFARFALAGAVDAEAESTDTSTSGDRPVQTSDLQPEDTVAPIPDCGFDLIAGAALYQGEPVIVGVDLTRDVAIAFRVDCTEVARASVR